MGDTMKRYIFLDNWVYSMLSDAKFERQLGQFITRGDYTILITSLLLTELYNEGWENAPEKDRMYNTTEFLGNHPSVIIDPLTVWQAEIQTYPNMLLSLPIELDLRLLPSKRRIAALLDFLRRDDSFIKQGKDIEVWRENYDQAKANWLCEVANIIQNACDTNVLSRDLKGNFINLDQSKEMFLLSLDLRYADTNQIDTLLVKLAQEQSKRASTRLTAIRLISLSFWYAYIEIDKANRIQHLGSDIGDLYNMSLIPYCTGFTLDKNMHRLTQRMKQQFDSIPCEIISRQKLDVYIKEST
jgi:hypothetical protein